MTLDELTQEMMKHSDELAVESYEPVMTGKYIPVKRHKKKRVQKKWNKRYGVKPETVMKKCKRIDVSAQTIIDFCIAHNYPMPSDFTLLFGGGN